MVIRLLGAAGASTTRVDRKASAAMRISPMGEQRKVVFPLIILPGARSFSLCEYIPMTLLQLIKLASKGYAKHFPESPLTDFVDEWGRPKDPPEKGDTLAVFIVSELNDTFDANASEDEQRDEAVRVMDRAMRDLQNVISALEYEELSDAQESADGVRTAFTRMLDYDGCPECKSPLTSEIVVSINGEDNVVVCSCENCGHIERKL